LSERIPSKKFQIAFLKRLFTLLNPGVDPELIDWEAVIDPTLRIPENRERLAKAYPMYTWYRRVEEKPKHEEAETDIAWLEYILGEAVSPEERESAFKILDELKKRASKAEELKKKVAELQKKVKEKPPTIPPEVEEVRRLRRRLEELAGRIEEIASEVREVRAAARAPPPPPPPPPPAPPALPFPTPRAVEKTDPVTGKRFIGLDWESEWYVRQMLAQFPREYFDADDERVRSDFGWPPLYRILQEAIEAGLVPPLYATFLNECAGVLKRARRERGLTI